MLLYDFEEQLQNAVILSSKLEYLNENTDNSLVAELFNELDLILKKEAVSDSIETLNIFLKEKENIIENLYTDLMAKIFKK
jgi:hypothetical protein